MTTYPGPLARLIQELSKLPGIGEKTAARLAFHMLKGKKEDVFALADSTSEPFIDFSAQKVLQGAAVALGEGRNDDLVGRPRTRIVAQVAQDDP